MFSHKQQSHFNVNIYTNRMELLQNSHFCLHQVVIVMFLLH